MKPIQAVLDALPVSEEQMMGMEASDRAILAVVLVAAVVVAAALIIRLGKKRKEESI